MVVWLLMLVPVQPTNVALEDRPIAVECPVRCEGRPAAVARADDDGSAVPLDRVPAAAKQAAVDAVPGLVLERASRETEDGIVVYELEGTAGGHKVEVEVTAEGKILEIEKDG